MERLKRRREFLRVAASRRRWVAPGLILQVGPHIDGGEDRPPRVGFTVSRKVGNAVERNRLRRRLKAAAAEVLDRCAAPGADYVVIGRAAGLTRAYGALIDDMRTALLKTGSCRSLERRGRAEARARR